MKEKNMWKELLNRAGWLLILLESFATLPFTSWTVACLIVVNALQFGRGPRQYTGSILQLILL